MIKKVEKPKKVLKKTIELQYLDYQDEELKSDLVNLLYDLNFFHYHHDFKERSERIVKLKEWFGDPNSVTTLEDNRKAHVWILDINETIYYMYVTNLGLFLETSVKTKILTAYKDSKELAKIMLVKSKKYQKD